MARRPNYSYEKNSRARAKAAKREAKRQQKAAARAEKKQGPETEDGVLVEVQAEDSPEPTEPEAGA